MKNNMNAKAKAINNKKNNVKSRLNHLRGELRKERISYGELAELGSKKYRSHLYEDPELAEASGMSEEEFNRHRKK